MRNIHEVTLDCGSGIHFIHGSNGQGKTSLLESIYLLSNLRSFRDSDLGALIQNGQPFAQVRGLFQIDPGTEAELRVDLIQNGARLEKRAYINQKLSKSAVDYFGVKLNHSPIQFHAINLNPTSTDLIRNEPAYRRTYFNQVVSSEDPEYLGILKRYQKIVDQKNALLKQEERFDPQLLQILNENLAREGGQVMFSRLKYLQKLASPVVDFLTKIAPSQDPVNLGYFSKIFQGQFDTETLYFTGHFEVPEVKILVENLHRKITQLVAQERVRKSSLVGPHRDDLIFKVIPRKSGSEGNFNGKNILDVGSQGEIRSLLLALKLSELEEFKKHTGVQPVLLIDDFSSELDTTRRGFLLNYLKDSGLQIFVTSTDHLANELDRNAKTIRMVEGDMA